MRANVSQKEIGKRIMGLRKSKGLSQEDLARAIGISRPSLAQIELGNRGLDTLELQKLSQILEFSLDAFLSRDFNLIDQVPAESETAPGPEDVRISVPALQTGKFKNVLLYILERCSGKPNMG